MIPFFCGGRRLPPPTLCVLCCPAGPGGGPGDGAGAENATTTATTTAAVGRLEVKAISVEEKEERVAELLDERRGQLATLTSLLRRVTAQACVPACVRALTAS